MSLGGRLTGFFLSCFLSGSIVAAELPIAPAEDWRGIRAYFVAQFPQLDFIDYINGSYAVDLDARRQWQSLLEFPPYEFALEDGATHFMIPFRNGNSYADCFAEGGLGIRQLYPYFDLELGEVVTLEWAINRCRIDNGEPALDYGRGELAKISAYMAASSKDRPLQISVPDNTHARQAYQAGKAFFYSRRGRLNMACASCHIYHAGDKMRTTTISPSLGQTTHFPAFRGKWQEIGTLHRRYADCQRNIGARPFQLQSRAYRELEYFHTYMSNTLPVNAPGIRP